MSQYLDFNGLTLYDKNVKKRTSEGYYNKDEVDNLLAGIETNILWKDAVATYDDIATTYPYPREGWTVNVLDTGNTYRYDGESWVRISAGAVPKATANNDGLMPKEMYQKLDGLGTASNQDYITTVDQSSNLPTSRAVQVYVGTALQQLSESLFWELSSKVDIEDVGDASEKDYTDVIPNETERIRVSGQWYSNDTDMFYLEGTGVDNGIDMTFFEEINNYTLHFNFINFSAGVVPVLHVQGTKTDPDTGEITPIDSYFRDGDVLVKEYIPDEYLDGTDSGSFEITVSDYEPFDVVNLDFLIYPVFHDEANNVDIDMINDSVYEGGKIIHQEYDAISENHILMGTYGLYSSSDLPTSSAVASLVRTVTQALQAVLEARIDGLEDIIDSYEEASDEDIENLFSLFSI